MYPMDHRERAEDWADGVLDAHRSAPAGSASIEDDLFADALRRSQERHAAFSKAYAIVVIVGVLLAGVFLFSLLETF